MKSFKNFLSWRTLQAVWTYRSNVGLDPAADEVQKIIERHHAFADQTHAATKDVYQAMALVYAEHPEFRKQLDTFHADLAIFMAEAMRIFADRKLS